MQRTNSLSIAPSSIVCKEPLTVPITPVFFDVRRRIELIRFSPITGSKSSIINLEARSLKTWSSRSRHCVFVLMDNFTTEEYEQISAGSGALVVIVPPAPYTQEQLIVSYYFQTVSVARHCSERLKFMLLTQIYIFTTINTRPVFI